jgi:hypothetical protein
VSNTSRNSSAAHHQQLQLTPSLGRAELVYVVDHQPDSVAQPRQVLQQPLGDRPPVELRGRRQRPHHRRPRGRLASAPSTKSQNRCGSPSSRPNGSHATRFASPATLTDDRSKTVFAPLGGADTPR